MKINKLGTTQRLNLTINNLTKTVVRSMLETYTKHRLFIFVKKTSIVPNRKLLAGIFLV